MNSYDYHRQAGIDKAIDKTGGVYPGGNGEDYLHAELPGVGYIASRWARTVSTVFVCTRAEFEARVAERRNKPDWSECPDWAHYVAQDSNGDWHWFSHKPLVTTANGWNSILGKFGFSQSGRVIGDWCNTLEQRPNAVGRHPLQVNLIPAVDGESPIDTANRMIHALLQRPNHIGESDEKGDVDAAIEPDPTVSLKSYRFRVRESFVAWSDRLCKELFPHAAPSDDSDWYDYEKQEAIKKPPVGIECEWSGNGGRHWHKTALIFLDETVFLTRGYQLYKTADDSVEFRPLDWDRNLQPNPEPELSPELSFHLSNAFNELQAGARLLPDSDPRKTQLAALAGAVSAIREVA